MQGQLAGIRAGDDLLRRVSLRIAAAVSLLLAGACEDSVPSTPPANSAPSFTSATAISVAENAAGTIYQAAATDSDGDSIGFTIAGGADAARFTLTPAGLLSFVASPNFEAPSDVGADNRYDVTLAANDGRGGTATLNLQVTVTDVPEPVTRLIGSGFVGPISGSMLFRPDRFYIAEGGSITLLATDGSGVKTVVLGAAGNTTLADGSTIIDIAVGDIMARPIKWPTGPVYTRMGFALVRRPNGVLAVNLYDPDVTPWRFLRVLTDSRSPPAGAVASAIDGSISIGDDYLLYLALSDAGVEDAASDPATQWGKLQCLHPANYYRPPLDQPASFFPCAAPASAQGMGFRRPGKLSIDRRFIADRGSGQQELNLFQPGGHYGWPYREGTAERRPGGPAGMIDPVLRYATGTGPISGGGIVGGMVYRGPFLPWRNLYIFGDAETGAIWSVPAALLIAGVHIDGGSFTRRSAEIRPNTGTIDRIGSFLEDEAGNIYILDQADGQVFRVDAP